MSFKVKAASGFCAMALSCGVMANEKTVKGLLLEKFEMLESHIPVRAIPGMPGLYEVNLYGQAAYTDERVSFFMVGGSLLTVDDKTVADWTVKRKEGLELESMSMFPLDMAIKRVYGKGENLLITMEDPNCVFCKKQSKVMDSNPEKVNATVYTFIYPILSEDSDLKGRKILCSKNPGESLRGWMVFGQEPQGDGDCKRGREAIDRIKRIGTVLGLNSTPVTIFQNGAKYKEAVTADGFEIGHSFAKSRMEDARKSLALTDGAATGKVEIKKKK